MSGHDEPQRLSLAQFSEGLRGAIDAGDIAAIRDVFTEAAVGNREDVLRLAMALVVGLDTVRIRTAQKRN